MGQHIKREVSLATLKSIEIPQESKSYKPVSHGALDGLIQEGISKNGFNLKNARYLIGQHGNQSVGMYDLVFDNHPHYGIKMLFQNSYNKTLTLKLAVGQVAWVCANGCVRGDMGAYKQKHVGEVQTVTPATVDTFLKNAGDTFYKLVKDKERMREIELKEREAAELLGRMYIQEGIITTNQLSTIKSQFDKPSFDYGYEKALLNLYENTTYALRDAHPAHWLEQHQNLHKFITKEFLS